METADEVFLKVLQDWMQMTKKWADEYLTGACDLSRLVKEIDSWGKGYTGSWTTGGEDPYSVFGLNRAATDDEIKQRYRAMLFKLHPDTAGIAGTEYLYRKIINAYQQIANERGWK